MITPANPNYIRDSRIKSLAKIFYKNNDEEEIWEKAISFGVTKRTAQDYVKSAIVLSKVAKRRGLFENQN